MQEINVSPSSEDFKSSSVPQENCESGEWVWHAQIYPKLQRSRNPFLWGKGAVPLPTLAAASKIKRILSQQLGASTIFVKRGMSRREPRMPEGIAYNSKVMLNLPVRQATAEL